MLRKTSHIILVLFLLVSTIGPTLSMHYCGGKLISTSLTPIHNLNCQKDCAQSCCANKTIHFEIKDDYVAPVQLKHKPLVISDVLFSVLATNYLFVVNDEKRDWTFPSYILSSPPIQTRLALFQTYIC